MLSRARASASVSSIQSCHSVDLVSVLSVPSRRTSQRLTDPAIGHQACSRGSWKDLGLSGVLMSQKETERAHRPNTRTLSMILVATATWYARLFSNSSFRKNPSPFSGLVSSVFFNIVTSSSWAVYLSRRRTQPPFRAPDSQFLLLLTTLPLLGVLHSKASLLSRIGLFPSA